MKYIVTGSAGFIGSALTWHLLQEGHDVLGVDALTAFYPRRIKDANLAKALQSDRFELIKGDLSQLRIEPLLEGADVVFHLAGQAGVRTSWEGEFEVYLRHNVLATQRLMEACRHVRPRRVVYASSSSIYGNAAQLPVSESVCGSPVSPYGATKLAGEQICDLYSGNFSIPVVKLRYFTVFGPRQRPDMAFHRFIRAGLAGETISVFGDGHQSRDFTYVDDVVAATVAAGALGPDGATYNVGGGSTWTVRQVLEVVQEILKRELNVEYLRASAGDVRETSADTTRAREDLGFNPQTDVETGLRRQVEWIRWGLAHELFTDPS
jgi:UDP-glucose 4-epimerase